MTEYAFKAEGMKKTVYLLAVGLYGAIAGCTPGGNEPRVVVYVALDREFSEPILNAFSEETGVLAAPKFDIESTKSVGLANAIIQEASRPRCDVFWNNEILNTLRLQRLGLLEAYIPPQADRRPAWSHDRGDRWHGFAARARVILVNTDLVANKDRPTSIADLADARWAGRTGLAKPLFGTTATHAACLFAAWGEERAKKFFRDLKANGVQVLSGNKQVATHVAAGRLAFGLTDTDDALIELETGAPVAIVYPDQGKDGLGTLFIPNVLAILKDCPHPAEARQLVDYLLTAEVEDRLAACPSSQIPLHSAAKIRPRVETPQTVRPMAVDFGEAAKSWDKAAEFLREEFAGAD